MRSVRGPLRNLARARCEYDHSKIGQLAESSFCQGFLPGHVYYRAKERRDTREISFPIPPRGTGCAFEKLTLGHGDFPLIVVSVVLRMENTKCVSVAIALGGVSDRVIRSTRAEIC